MRHLGKLAATGLAAGLLTTACGGGVADVLAGLTPNQVITLASSKVTGQSYRMAIHGTVAIDASQVQGLPAGALDQMSSILKSFTVDGKADVQSAQRLRLTMSMSLPQVGDKPFVAVLYDGKYYLSLDGGKTFADGGDFNLQGLAASPTDIKSLLSGTVDARNLGTTVHDGQSVEHIRATLGPNYFSNIFDKIGGSGAAAAGAAQLGDLLKQIISIRTGTVDAYVRTLDGRVESATSNVVLALDMGKMMSILMQQFGGQIPSGSAVPQISGSMLMTVNGTDRFTDYGAAVTVTKPSVDPSAPGFSSLFGRGA